MLLYIFLLFSLVYGYYKMFYWCHLNDVGMLLLQMVCWRHLNDLGVLLLQIVLLTLLKWCEYAAAMNCFVDVISMIFYLSNTLQLNCEFFILWWLQPHFYAFLLCCGYKIFSWQHLTLRKIYQQKTLSLSCHANSH